VKGNRRAVSTAQGDIAASDWRVCRGEMSSGADATAFLAFASEVGACGIFSTPYTISSPCKIIAGRPSLLAVTRRAVGMPVAGDFLDAAATRTEQVEGSCQVSRLRRVALPQAFAGHENPHWLIGRSVLDHRAEPADGWQTEKPVRSGVDDMKTKWTARTSTVRAARHFLNLI
jgi:hypothetical protein